MSLVVLSVGLPATVWADNNGYHNSTLTAPATDTDGNYSVSWSAAANGSVGQSDVVLGGALGARLNGTGSWTVVPGTPVYQNSPLPVSGSVSLSGQAAGTHNYWMTYAVYGPTTGYQVLNDYHDVVVTTSGGGGGNNGIATPPNEVTSGTAVGTLPMAMDVAANGDAVASVPFQLIPGVAGFQPSLGLVYSSGRAVDRAERSLPEDTIGYGWRLSGLSQIRRCVVNQVSSNSIALNSSDSLCLDGIPLVHTNSTAHLTVGAAYRTQLESYRHIVIKDGGSGAIWFEVTAADGTVMEYGNGNGSRVDKSGGVDYQWSISKATDTTINGNEIAYNYYHDAAKGINYPINIVYEGAEVDFEYRTRTDASAVNIGSASQTQSVFLHTIKVSMGSTTVREYRLFDEVVNSKRRLNKVQQCGYDQSGSNLTCLKATDINWNSSVQVSNITNGLGAINHFEYTALTSGSGSLFTETPPGFSGALAPTSTQVVSGRTVVTRIRRDNGLGSLHNTSYAYLGTGLQSTKHWGFLGFFAQRIKDDQSGITTYVQYRQDYPYFGSVARVSQYDSTYTSGSETLTRTETAYTSHTETYNSVKTDLPYAQRTTSFIYEGNDQIGVSETENSYGINAGYITQVVSTSRTGTGSNVGTPPNGWGQVFNYTVNDVKSTVINTSKFTNRTSGGDWLIGFVNEILTSSSGGSTTGTIDQKTTFDHDGDSLRVANFTRFPNVTALTLTTTYTYDNMGRTTNTNINGTNVDSRDTQAGQLSGFDASRYPLNFTNDLGQNTSIGGCDLRFGAYQSATDANGETRSVDRDPFGRVISMTNNDGVTVTTTYEDCANVSCPTIGGAAGAYRVKTSSPVTPLTYRYYDKLGREIRTITRRFDNSGYSYQNTYYDTRGRVQKYSLPYFSGGTAYYVTPTYDVRDRVTRITRPDGSYTDTSYSVSGSDVVVTVLDRVNSSGGSFVEDQTKVSKYNVLGQLVEVKDGTTTTNSSDLVTIGYVYDANGNPTTVTVNGGSAGTTVSTMEYDAAGNRTQLTGPDVGTINTTYTALGQILTNTDAESQTTTFVYDTLGRLTSRTRPGAGGVGTETASWVWDTATNGQGRLHSRSMGSFVETYSYNGDGKLVTIATNHNSGSGGDFTTTHTYDSHGRPYVTSHPGGFAVKREYNSRGYLHRLKDNASGDILQTFNNTNAFGNVTDESYGNGVDTTRSYDPKTGQLTAIDTDKGSTVLQNLDYAWRSNGTLESRIANPSNGFSATRKETFGYDAHNRLIVAETFINGSNTRDLNYAYNALGNITSKTSNKVGDTDVTEYGYHSTKKHAVTSATINDGSGAIDYTMTYDNNGAITKYNHPSNNALDKHIEYNAANQPTTIVVGSSPTTTTPTVKEEFKYGPDGQRYSRLTTYTENGNAVTEAAIYIGDYEIVAKVIGVTVTLSEKTRIGSNIIHQKHTDELYNITSGVEYLHRDHLGSVESVTDENGNRLYVQQYEPFGSRKDSDWTQNLGGTELAALRENLSIRTSRGYTGHEHLDRTGFVHMNGRVYDPVLGRFLSPDPIVQSPSNSQSWNRYSYVYNNPLAFTDPDGFEAVSEREAAEEIVVVGTRLSSLTGLTPSAFALGRGLDEERRRLQELMDLLERLKTEALSRAFEIAARLFEERSKVDDSKPDIEPEQDDDPCGQQGNQGPIKWTGSDYSWSFGKIGAAYNWSRFTLTSEIVNGQRARIVVDGSGFGAGEGSPISNTGGSIEFETPRSRGLDPNVFVGDYLNFSVEYTPLGIGYGASTVQLGEARSSGRGVRAGVLGLGAFEVFGDTEIESFSIENIDCNN